MADLLVEMKGRDVRDGGVSVSLEDDAACHYGDHGDENGHCSNCGHVNYHLLGWLGAVARWAKEWGVSREEADERIVRGQIQHDIDVGVLEGVVDDYL